MIVLSGASASGKTEAAKMLMTKHGIKRAITTTTRPMRSQEVDGRDYFFVSKETFEKLIADGAFVEYTIYNGNYYGSTKNQIADNRSVVIDLEGLKSYTQFNDKRIVTFYLSASEELCYKRMLERGDTVEDAQRRIANDRKLFARNRIPKVDYIIDSGSKSIEEVADEVYRLYNEHLKVKHQS
jgi:guanylate kinase